MAIYVFANHKGGVGKTTVTMNCAHAAAAAGQRVLLVDMDTQGNTTHHMSGYTAENPPEYTLADVLDRKTLTPVEDAVVPTKREGVDLLASGFGELQAVADSLVGKPGAENSLHRALRPVADRWDQVFIDTGPTVDLVTRNAFMAADALVIVVEPEYDAIAGIAATLTALDQLVEYLDKDLPVAGWVVNRMHSSRNDHADYLGDIRRGAQDMGVPVLGDPIGLRADVSRLAAAGLGIDQHPRPSAKDRNLAGNFTTIVEQITTTTGGAA